MQIKARLHGRCFKVKMRPTTQKKNRSEARELFFLEATSRVIIVLGGALLPNSLHLSGMKSNSFVWLHRLLWLTVASLFVHASCKDVAANAGSGDGCTVMFYNVENLFDTSDDPKTDDSDFTPAGKLKWDDERYRTKLKHIEEVVSGIDAQGPALVGLCEVENGAVLNDLVRQPFFKDKKYTFVHRDSPDERGIDVALLYRKGMFQPETTEFFQVPLQEAKDRTREVLYVKGKLQKEDVHVFVNHWPSRSKGQAESEPDRMSAARVVKMRVDSILNLQKDARIVIMGDLNDHPDDKSVRDVLGAVPPASLSGELVNMMWSVADRKEGSHYYKGEWGALDQIIVSSGMIAGNAGWLVKGDAQVWKQPLVLFTDRDGNARPNRTYVGNDYKGGYSDHLPVFIALKK
jgi:predicted extracellular nuclease